MEKVSTGIRTYNPPFVSRTLLPLRHQAAYSSTELCQLGFCELQQLVMDSSSGSDQSEPLGQ
jgi:hypothetical protein